MRPAGCWFVALHLLFVLTFVMSVKKGANYGCLARVVFHRWRKITRVNTKMFTFWLRWLKLFYVCIYSSELVGCKINTTFYSNDRKLNSMRITLRTEHNRFMPFAGRDLEPHRHHFEERIITNHGRAKKSHRIFEWYSFRPQHLFRAVMLELKPAVTIS